MTDTKDINPVYVDGEPVCSNDCLCILNCAVSGMVCVTIRAGETCVPALRRDRDEARWGLCLMEAHSRHVEWKNKDDRRASPKGVADEHGWQYLYKEILAAADAEE